MNTEEEQRDKHILSEKRATLRSRSITKESIKNYSYSSRIIIGSGLTIVFILLLLSSSFQSSPAESLNGNNFSENNVSVNINSNVHVTSLDSESTSSDSIVPVIKIRNPKNNSELDSATPQLNFLVAGNNLEDVKYSIDNTDPIEIPHDEKIAEINSFIGLIFIEDFSGGAKRWSQIGGDWKVVDGEYLQSNYNKGINAEAYYPLNSTNYILEYKTKIVNIGNTLQSKFGFLGKTGSSYSVVLFAKEKKVGLLRTDSWEAIKMVDYPIQPDTWYKVKLIVNKTQIVVYINNELVIDTYVDLFYNEGITLSSWESQVYFDDIQVYVPLINGFHKLQISAKNKGGTTTLNNVYFTINITSTTVENVRAGIGSTITKGGLSVRLERINILTYYTSIWVRIENNKDQIMPVRLTPVPVIIDNLGTQYENIKVERSAEIAQTELQPKSKRDGAIFFEKIKEGAKPKKLMLYLNGESFEYFLD